MTGEQVLGDGLAHEMLGRDHPTLACVYVRLRGHTQHAAEMVEVAMGIDDCCDQSLAEMSVGQLEAGARGGGGGERVDDDPARLTCDERDVGDVVAACLPHTGRHLEQTVDVVQLRLAPQAGVHGVGVG